MRNEKGRLQVSNMADLITNLSLESAQKMAQILFYFVVATIAVFTFLKAKNGLLNSVNTEYQKKVIERLLELSIDFREHFDTKSPHYWANDRSITRLVDDVNNAFLDGPYLEYDEEYPYGYSRTAMSERIQYLLGKVKADPLIPSQIRNGIFETLDHITFVREAVHHAAVDEYYEHIKQGGELYKTDGTDFEYQKFHNKIIQRLADNECGISEMEHRIIYINEIIQVYLESFDPVKAVIKIPPYIPYEPQPIRVVEIQ